MKPTSDTSISNASSNNNPSNNAPSKSASLLDWLNYMQGIHVSAIDMGLSRVLPVAEKLNVINAAKNSYVFMVAGTNGKGSTTAVIAEICRQAGYKTALYQSPHLIEFNERVRTDGVCVDDDTLIHAFEKVEQARIECDISLSFFEMTTLSAMLIFAESQCEVWVLEIGLGGRLDVVNIIDPDITVITNIGVDHVDWLGDDREKIGYEKAGILRKGIPLIFGDAAMPQSVQQQINELAVPCYQVGQNFYHTENVEDENGWQYSNASISMQLPKPNISLVNVSNAISAIQASELNISYQAIKNAMTEASLAGRFDYREMRGRHWLFDVGHNEEGVKFLLNQLQSTLPNFLNSSKNNTEIGKVHLAFSMLADKDIDTVVKILTTTPVLSIDSWHIAPVDPTYNPRSADVQQLLNAVSKYVETGQVNTYQSLSEATQKLIQLSSAEDLILVCGSFHTISEVIVELNG